VHNFIRAADRHPIDQKLPLFWNSKFHHGRRKCRPLLCLKYRPFSTSRPRSQPDIFKVSSSVGISCFPRECYTSFPSHLSWINHPNNIKLGSRYSEGLSGPGSIPGMPKFFSSPQRPDRLWGPLSIQIQWVPGLTLQRREADHSPPFNAEFKNDGILPPLPVCLHGIVLKKLSTGTSLPFIRLRAQIMQILSYVQCYLLECDHWEDQDVGGWTILKWILER
jgi:hypothetical protein